ncbi:MAG: PqqD family protein [Pseudomonadota bacterium]|nr:PqqD family protein [Pseudomonadota bacterium]
MSLIGKIQQYLPLGHKPTLPRGETLALRPVRNRVVTWERPETEDPGASLRLTVPRRQEGMGRLLGRFFPMPDRKTIELDEFGAEVWELCDGAHSVEQLVTHTCAKYKLNRRQGEVSVVAFMKMLAQRRLIGFITKEKERPHDNQRPQRQRRAGRARRRN